MKRKGFLALFATTATLGEISWGLIWRGIQKQKTSGVMILAIGKAPQARMSLTGGPQKRDGEVHIQWSMPGGAVELMSAMLSVEDIAKAPQERLNLTGGPPMTLEEAHIQWSVPGGAVELLSDMLSVEDIAKAPQERLNLTGGPQKMQGEAPF